MKKPERIDFILKKLESLYPETPIPLDHTDSYTLLIAVLLSAQCTDVRVNKITPALFAMANNPKDMATHSADEIREIIRPCGLSPKKSLAILNLSILLNNEYAGQVPESFEALESLPGVGHKTASVVMAQAFGHPTVPVDTHIHRLMERWKLSKGKNVELTEKDFKKCFKKELWNKLHLQIIFYGREYCKARQHTISECPICFEISSEKTKKDI